MTVTLGHVEQNGVKLEMSLRVNPDRTVDLKLWVCDLSSRRSGEMLTLDERGATELKELLDHAEATVARMVAARQIVGLARR